MGASLVAIQALEKRPTQLQEQNDELKKQNKELAVVIEKMQRQVNQIADSKDKKL